MGKLTSLLSSFLQLKDGDSEEAAKIKKDPQVLGALGVLKDLPKTMGKLEAHLEDQDIEKGNWAREKIAGMIQQGRKDTFLCLGREGETVLPTLMYHSR